MGYCDADDTRQNDPGIILDDGAAAQCCGENNSLLPGGVGADGTRSNATGYILDVLPINPADHGFKRMPNGVSVDAILRLVLSCTVTPILISLKRRERA